MLDIGRIVFSKCGRDKGKPFVIVSIEAEYVYLVDGHSHKVSKPKKKKGKHVQLTNHYFLEMQQIVEARTGLLDADVRKALAQQASWRESPQKICNQSENDS